ncbi:MAG: response regulator transcription factor [Dinghuibacter sp.]|nr:response regulator transcription factor [Dinghuibacter sp.]
MINVALIDDHKIFSASLKEFLSRYPRLHPQVIEPLAVSKVIPLLRDQNTHVVVTDLFMPHISGFTLVKEIRESLPEIRIVVLSLSEELSVVNQLVDMGIHSYLSKSDEPEHLVEAIHAVHDKLVYKSRLFTDALYWNALHAGKQGQGRKKAVFSQREKKIIQMLWEEKSNTEIAASLFLGVRSIEKIRQDMKEKAGVKTTLGLLKYALSNYILMEGSLLEKEVFYKMPD